MNRKISMVWICAWVLAQVAWADRVVLTNNDRLTGKIEKLQDGKLDFTSALAGKMQIDLANIQTFASDEPIEVHLKDGTTVKRKVTTAADGQFGIESGDTVRPQTLMVADIVAINPPAKPVPAWHGQISGGWTHTTGNTRSDSQNLSAAAIRRSENDRISLNMDYGRGRQVNPTTNAKITTEDWWRAKGRYDYFVSKRFYAYGDGRYEKDAIALLERRVLFGGGAGYQWIETARTKFATDLGLASLYEKYKNLTESKSEMSLQLGYNFDYRLTPTVRFLNDLTYYPSLSKVSDYYLTTTAEMRANLTKRMFGNFKVIFNFDETPAPDRGSTDIKYILGVGMDF